MGKTIILRIVPLTLMALLAFSGLAILAVATSSFTNGQPANLVVGEPNFTTAGCSETATTQCDPYTVAFSAGNLWVADEGNDRVLQHPYPSSNGEAATLGLGSNNLNYGGVGTCSGYPSSTSTGSCLADIREMTFDSSGNLYVSDHVTNGIDLFKTPFTTGMSGSLALGGLSCALANAGPAQLCQPDGLPFDKQGSLWVTDGSLGRVLEFTPPFSAGEAASIVIGQPDFTTRTSTGACNPATSLSLLCEPKGIAFDPSGSLWVSDSGGDRVLEYVPGASGCSAGQFCNGMNASLVVGTTPGCPYPPTASTLCIPRGIVFDASGNLWVADSGDYRVLAFAPPFTSSASVVLGQAAFLTGSFSTSQTSVGAPVDLAFDASGNLWVSDNGNSRVLEFASAAISTSMTSTSSSSSSISTAVSSTATSYSSSSTSVSSSSTSSSSSSSTV